MEGWFIVALSTVVFLAGGCLADSSIVLTAGDFDDVISTHPLVLVEFHAPWCGHCQRLAPEFEQAAAILSEEGVVLGKVDATEEKQLADRFSVERFPTLKIFRDGDVFDYDGPQHSAGIVDYMRDMASPHWAPPPSQVLILTERNFTATVTSSTPTLVEFYAPWCGHCKKLAPAYQRAAADLKNMGSRVALAQVDATVETKLAKQYEVKGYPTLKLFRDGKDKEFTGSRDTKGIVEYMLRQAMPGSQEVTSRQEFHSLKRDTFDPLILTFGSGEADPVIRAHLAAADEGRGQPVQFAHSFSPELATSYDLTSGETAIFIPKWFRSQFDPEMKPYRISLEEEEEEREEGEGEEGRMSRVLSDLLEVSRPLVGLRIRGNEAWFNRRPLLVLYCDIEEADFVRSQVSGVARDYLGRLTVALSNIEEYQKELDDLGLGDWGEDISVGLWGTAGKERYAMTTPTSPDNIRLFIEEYFSGQLWPVLRSQPKPRHSNDGAVTMVVGSTFHDLVLDPEHDVLVEFYAPYCELCQTLVPVYQQLARRYQSNTNLVVAKFDASANDAPPQFEFEGVPALFYVPAGERSSPVRYQGGRWKYDDLVEFVESHIPKDSTREEL